tara:strand:- start:17 stop:247 length:231 start_codon:yes stop_codon:yes gene_type:complete
MLILFLHGNIFALSSVEVRLLLTIFLIIGTLALFVLVKILNNILEKQAFEKVEEFSNAARIPRFFRKQINISIRWI